MPDVCHHRTQLAVTTGQIENIYSNQKCLCHLTLYNLLVHVKIVLCIFLFVCNFHCLIYDVVIVLSS